MRLGFDGKRAMFNFRGLGNYSRGLIEGLLDFSDHQCLIFSSPPKDARAMNWVNHQNSKHPKKFLFDESSSSLKKLTPSLWRSFFIKKELNRSQIDLFHGLSHEIPFGLQNSSFKKIVTMHDLIFIRYPEYFPMIDRLSYFKKITYACKHSDLVLAICEQTKNDLIRYLKVDEKKIKIHYQSCDPIFYERRNQQTLLDFKKKFQLTEPFILNVGAFEERKNQLHLIEAFNKIKDFHPHQLVLVGTGKDYLKKCNEKIESLHLSKRVRIFNRVSFEELPLFYQSADLFCFPSHFEGFGIPIVEALFSEVPIITSLGSCFPESAGPQSVFVDSRSLEELVKAIDQVLSSPEKKREMANQGLIYAQRFKREHSTLDLCNHYRQLF